MAKTTAVLQPNKGLYLGQDEVTIPAGGLVDGNNFRVRYGKLSSFNIGYEKFVALALNGPVTLMDLLLFSDGSFQLVGGTLTDLYLYNVGATRFDYLSPRYETGTASTVGTAVTGVGTLWNTTANGRVNAVAGDQISFGTTGVVNPAATWFTILTVNSDTSLTLSTNPGNLGANPYTLRQRFNSGNLNNYWRSEFFPRADAASHGGAIKDRWYATNGGADYPVVWDGIATQVVRLGAIGFKAKEVIRFKNMLIWLNFNEDSGAQKPFSFKNSDAGKPETFVGGIAGEFVAAPRNNAILGRAQIGDDLVIYTNDQIVMCTFVQAPDLFAFRTAVNGMGAVAGRLIADFPDGHHFVGRDSLYVFNGVTAQSIDMHIWRDIIRRQDQNRIKYGFAIFDEENADLIWAMPLAADSPGSEGPKTAYPMHYLEGDPQRNPNHPYSKRDFPFTVAGYYVAGSAVTWNQLTAAWNTYSFAWGDRTLAGAFPLVLVGAFDGNVYKLNTQNTANAAAIPSYVTFPRRFIGDYRARNMVRRVYPFVRQQPGVSYTLICTTTVYEQEGQITGSSTVNNFDMTMPSGGLSFVSPYRRGRLAGVQFGTLGSTTGQPWELSGYDWDILPGGKAS